MFDRALGLTRRRAMVHRNAVPAPHTGGLLMFVSRVIPPAVLLPALAGCALSPAYLVSRSSIAQHLPDGVRMDDFVERGPLGRKITVGEKLAQVGAAPGPDGKLYDHSGKRVEFFRYYDGGAPPPPGMLEAAERQLAELKKTCTVIEILHDPDLPSPP
jgi:hypothetical protein